MELEAMAPPLEILRYGLTLMAARIITDDMNLLVAEQVPS